MLVFLIALILFVFGFSSIGHPPLDPTEIISLLDEQIWEVESPQANPRQQHQSGNALAEENSSNLPGQDLNEPDPSKATAIEENADGSATDNPDTSRLSAYNNSSGKVITSVAAVAVENAPPLVSCAEDSELCEAQPTSESPPIPDPTPTPIHGLSDLVPPIDSPKPPSDCPIPIMPVHRKDIPFEKPQACPEFL